ncbi:MAG: phosphoribosylformylglycinamidine synthase subunit PurQ [Bryobacterales bacterium]|nr:phosphoribosylformylglycinamidine synthase subunit PurQ [Bryobacterales bacterium]
MKFGVVIFPGSNCDHDALYALSCNLGHEAIEIWHESEELGGADAVFLPGGFSYGDYLRCGALARFSPVIRPLRRFASNGGLVIGVCNGFQILCEAGLLDGALLRNRDLRFICRTVEIVPGTRASAFTSHCPSERPLRIPIAHGEGCYFANESVLDRLEKEDRIAFRYSGANPNGSARGIAGVLSEGRNVLGMMPHPERACDEAVGSTDGIAVFRSMAAAFAKSQVVPDAA